MAKLKDLAGLAALGAIGYKLSQQGKDDAGKMADSSSYAPSDARTKSSVMAADMSSPAQSAMDETNAGVLKALSAPKAAPNDQAGNQGVVSPKSSTPAAKTKTKSSVGSGTRPSSVKNPNYSNEGRSSTVAAKNPDYSNEGRGSAPTASTSKPQFEMPISKFFKGIRAAGEKDLAARGMKRGGEVKKMASGGMTSSASKRADGIATKGKTRGKIC
jgi:hypothetical protein